MKFLIIFCNLKLILILRVFSKRVRDWKFNFLVLRIRSVFIDSRLYWRKKVIVFWWLGFVFVRGSKWDLRILIN